MTDIARILCETHRCDRKVLADIP